MKIKYKKKGDFEVEFNEYFKSVNDLKNFIKENNKFINVDKLEDKITKIYFDLVKSDGSIKSSLLSWFIFDKFGFKYKRPNNLNFWLERGYGIEEFNKSNGKEIKALSPLIKNTFKYNKFKFEFIGIPKCRLCNSELIINPSIGRYEIIGCSNINCETNKHKEIESISHLGFLPIEIFQNKNKRVNINSKTNKEYWLLKGYSYADSLNEIDKIKFLIKNVNIGSFEYYKLTTDKNDDEIKSLIRLSSPTCVEYWKNKGYDEYESKNKVSKLQKQNSDKLVKRRLESPDCYSATTQSQVGYWIKKGYSQEKSKIKVSERQKTFSLDICIKKYGENGKKKFNERQNKWLKSLLSNGNMVIGYSKISQVLFHKLLESYDNNIDKNNIFFATHNKEFKLEKLEGGFWLYDFTDLNKKKIIEFNGDMFHGNPNKYKSTDYPHPFRKNITAQEIWDKDSRKIEVANNHGFDVLIIWDSEYRWGNKQEIINKCIAFLNNK